MKEDNMKQGWEIKKLGDITNSINGLWTGKKPPFITIAVIRNTNFTKECKLDTSDIAYIDVEVKQYANRKLQYGDIIIEKSGGSDKQPVGRPILFNIKDGEYSFSNFTSTIRVNDKMLISPNFLHKYLAFIYGRGDTTAMQSKTTGIRNLDFNLYKSINVPVPPLSVQEQIVSELDLLSGIIEKKREQLKELDALAQSIFYDMFGDPITNEKGWEVKKLGEVCESVSYGTSNSSSENGVYKYLRMNNITYSGQIDITDIKYIDISEEEYEKYVVRKGDILFNRTNSKDLVGKTALFNFEEEMIIAGYIIRVRVNQDSISPTFVVKWLNTPFMKSYFKNICKGAVNQSNINSKELKNISIPLPPLSLQNQFASKIEAIERQKELIKQSISETETLFNARMQEHFG